MKFTRKNLPAPPAPTPDNGPPAEGAACLSGVIDAQAELAAVDLDPETLLRVAAEGARLLTGADGAAVARLLAERTAALAALRESEERFRNAFEHASIGMAIVALDGRWTRVNRALCEIVGYAESELLSTDSQHVTHPDDLEADFEATRRLVAGDVRFFHLTKRYFHKLGHVVWGMLSMSLVRDEQGRPLYFIAQIQDVTRRKQSEWLEDDRRDVLEMVARHQPLDAILHRLCRMAERQVPGVSASVMLLQDGSLRNVGPNLPPEFNEALRPRMLSLTAALCARAELHGGFAACDVATDPEWAPFRDAAFASALRGCWAAPVRSSDGDFLGMVALYLRHARQPDEWGQRLLDYMAKLATVAIEHRELAEQLTHRAFHDPLTGLPNRVLFEERMEHAMARARRNRTSVALLAVDLDRFKSINDSLGHEAGDELLQQFSQRIQGSLRETDTVARVGGDEFMVVLPDLNDPAGAEVVARKLVDTMQAAFHVAGRDLRVTASIGVCVYPRDAQDLASLQRGSDAALYRAKGSWGRFALASELELGPPDSAEGHSTAAPLPLAKPGPALYVR